MKVEKTLRRRLKWQEALLEAVSAMKSLSAHHFRLARATLPPAREYRNAIEQVVASIEFPQPVRTSPPALLLIGTDRGLCDGYTSRLVREALDENQRMHYGRVYCIGRRSLRPLEQSGLTVSKLYPSPTSVAGLTRVLLQVAQEILGDYLQDEFSSLHVVSAMFEGVGQFKPVSACVLPVTAGPTVVKIPLSDYVSHHHLMAVALREFLHITLFEILLDALAAEHGARLAATQSAEEWLQDRTNETRRNLASIRREVTTQEVLDIVAGARQSRKS